MPTSHIGVCVCYVRQLLTPVHVYSHIHKINKVHYYQGLTPHNLQISYSVAYFQPLSEFSLHMCKQVLVFDYTYLTSVNVCKHVCTRCLSLSTLA